jgi:hypothetical protein
MHGPKWFASAVLRPSSYKAKLDELAEIYRVTIDARFTCGLGDPLEINVFKILLSMRAGLAERRSSAP